MPEKPKDEKTEEVGAKPQDQIGTDTQNIPAETAKVRGILVYLEDKARAAYERLN